MVDTAAWSLDELRLAPPGSRWTIYIVQAPTTSTRLRACRYQLHSAGPAGTMGGETGSGCNRGTADDKKLRHPSNAAGDGQQSKYTGRIAGLTGRWHAASGRAMLDITRIGAHESDRHLNVMQLELRNSAVGGMADHASASHIWLVLALLAWSWHTSASRTRDHLFCSHHGTV